MELLLVRDDSPCDARSDVRAAVDRPSARQKRNKQHRNKNGPVVRRYSPVRYRAQAGRLVSNPAEVERIHEVVRRMLDAMHSIVTDWNNRGIQTRKGNHWRQANLRSIVLNRVMLGDTVLGTQAQWEPIIDQRTFDRMNTFLTDPNRKVMAACRSCTMLWKKSSGKN